MWSGGGRQLSTWPFTTVYWLHFSFLLLAQISVGGFCGAHIPLPILLPGMCSSKILDFYFVLVLLADGRLGSICCLKLQCCSEVKIRQKIALIMCLGTVASILLEDIVSSDYDFESLFFDDFHTKYNLDHF
jgi:hypothetical protein